MQTPPPPPPSLPEGEPPIITVTPAESRDVQPPSPRISKGCVWFLIGSLGCLAVLLLALIAPVILGISTANNTLNTILNIFQPNSGPQTATITSTQTLLQGIQPLGQLVSVRTELAKADIRIGIQGGALNACGFSADHVAQGAVEGGIDLTGITENSINYDAATNTYTLRLPAPQLTSCNIESIRQYSRSFTTCAVDWDEARVLAEYRALLDFRDDALEGGILNRAQVEAELVIRNFVELLTESRVQIIFQQPETVVLPRSCTPDMPEGWQIDAQTGQWIKNQ
ncbi:MAG: DUF4230 domain-containing protein [Anaerolineae bacterium]|nr:DUF4230 domain-containing protein [Anaerolineae bacterium]